MIQVIRQEGHGVPTPIRTFVPTIVALAALLLAACTTQQGGTAQPSPLRPFNHTDVIVAQHLVTNNQQAMAVATTALSHAGDATVRQLAGEIVTEHAREIQTMTDWLQTWQEALPAESPTALPTLPPEPDLDVMIDVHGAHFDRRFLQAMVSNHQHAVALAEVGLAEGANADAHEFAEAIQLSRSARISQMQRLLTTPTPR